LSKPLRGVFVGKIVEGRFACDDMARLKRVLAAREGKPTRIEVGPVPRDRSDPQLAFYWAGVVRPIAEWSGQPEDQVHDYLKEKVLRPLLEKRLWLPMPDGSHIEARPSTGLLSLDEMNRYIFLSREFAQQEWPDLVLPDIDSVSMR
jgi:hypothetical protein